MNLDSLDFIRCPACGGDFDVAALDRRDRELRHGFLSCSCDRYPVVAGIPVLHKDRSALLDEVRGALDRGRPEAAFMALVAPPLPRGLEPGLRRPAARRLVRRLHQRLRRPRFPRLGPATAFGEGGGSTAAELLELYCDNSPEDFFYLAYRFGHPRHLVALALGSLARRTPGPLLDLGCGCGHVAFNLQQMAPGESIVGVDTFYFGLWLASRRLAPGGTYVCCHADRQLPFPDGFFASATCVDSFHYFVDKAAAARELVRVVGRRGPIVLTGLHNRNVERALQFGDPLTPREYSGLFASLPHRILADERILERYVAGTGPDLAAEVDPEVLDRAPLVSLIAARDPSALDGPARLPEPPPHCAGPPAWNPLYAHRRVDGEIELSLRFPSPAFAADQPAMSRYLPPRLRVPSEVADEIRRREWTDRLRRLADRFVVLAMPPGFI
jgi:SAM-dependent methyltransferase/uncharacterized protein YbaR (Trm112 family)